MKSLSALAALAMLIAAPAPVQAAGTGGKAADPERRICKSKPVVGSRLKRIRECATAEQWEEMKLQEQVGLMRRQVNGDPGCNGGGSASCNPIKSGGRDTPW
ncbi:MAG TPA: hypothetical protein VF605_08885 [Allosphingosinicella sp.]|jgi:hypothetical protein